MSDLSMAVVIYTSEVTWVLNSLNSEPAYNWSRNMLLILLSLRPHSKNVPHPSHPGHAWMRGPFLMEETFIFKTCKWPQRIFQSVKQERPTFSNIEKISIQNCTKNDRKVKKLSENKRWYNNFLKK